jgi:hypothetical protein
MSEQLTSIPIPVRRRPGRTATAVACVAVLIAAGGYGATTTFGPDAGDAPVPSAAPPSDQVLQSIRDSVEGQYGTSAAPRTPSARELQRIRDGLARQYR